MDCGRDNEHRPDHPEIEFYDWISYADAADHQDFHLRIFEYFSNQPLAHQLSNSQYKHHW